MATITIDGQPFETRLDTNLLQACLSAGADLPYFCWHPELGSVGACRQCAVKQYSGPEDRKGRIVMACMTAVSDGARLDVADAEAADFRSSVIEWLMSNHPHDCPVCEEGGECHLQDMTAMTGHHSRRYRFTKRTHRNQNLGPFVKHEMNRCIACYRCVRFYRDYAGGEDLAAFSSHNNVYFGRDSDGRLENDFSGNLVEVCPTGVFTDKPFSSVFTRKWDMRGAPSICPHCAVGCNIIVNERAGRVRRVLNRYHAAVNRYFLCDRGRFGVDFVNAPGRLRAARRRSHDGQKREIGATEATLRFGNALREGAVIGIGSPRASLEANFALQTLVGVENFYLGIPKVQQAQLLRCLAILRRGECKILTLHEAESADAVLVLGEDVCKTAPRLGLALRQSVRQRSFVEAETAHVPVWLDASVRNIGADLRAPLFVATPAATDLDPIACAAIRMSPADITRLTREVTALIASDGASGGDDISEPARLIASSLTAAHRPLVVCGLQCLSQAGLQAAAALAAALRRVRPQAGLILALPECNSLGLVMLGGEPLEAALATIRSGAARTMIVLENDLARRLAPDQLQPALDRLANLIVLDHTESPTTEMADLLLPSSSFTESSGTFVSSEGRAQRYFEASPPKPQSQDAWRWIRDASKEAHRNQDMQWQRIDDVIAALGVAHPELAGIRGAAPGADFRNIGSLVRSEPHRSSGRTAIAANISVRDHKPPTNPDAPLSMTMEGYYGQMPASLLPYFWAPGWNSGHSLNKFQDEVGGAMRGGDQGVRLFGGSAGSDTPSEPEIAELQAAGNGELLLVPRMALFGTEELSRHAPAALELIATAVLHVSRPDWDGLDADQVELTIAGVTQRVAVEVDDSLPAGIASFPAHTGLFSHFAAPERIKLTRHRMQP